MYVEEGELLSPVHGVVRGIQVDRNQASFAVQPLGLMLNDNICQLAKGWETKQTVCYLESSKGLSLRMKALSLLLNTQIEAFYFSNFVIKPG